VTDHTELREKALAATPGPWEATKTAWGMTLDDHDGAMIFIETCGVTYSADPADAEFIAAANPAVVLSLLDENDRLRAAITEALGVVRSGSAPLGVTEARHYDRLLAESRRILSAALNTEEN